MLLGIGPESWANVIICVVLAVGVSLHRVTRLHVPLMLAGFVMDLALVLYLQLTRDAVGKAVAGVPALRYFHISVAVLSVLLYFALIPSGYRLLKLKGVTAGGPEVAETFRAARLWHKALASVFGLARGATLVTSFVITPPHW
jgi:hypothetical protein